MRWFIEKGQCVCLLSSIWKVGPALASTWEDLCCSLAVDLLNGFEPLCSGKCRYPRFMINVSLALAEGSMGGVCRTSQPSQGWS